MAEWRTSLNREHIFDIPTFFFSFSLFCVEYLNVWLSLQGQLKCHPLDKTSAHLDVFPCLWTSIMLPLTFVTYSFIHLLMPVMYQIWDRALSHFCISHGAYILACGNSLHKQHMEYVSQLYSILEGLKRSGMGKGKRIARLGWSEVQRLPSHLSWSRIRLQCRRPQFDSWIRKIPWRRYRLPTSVFLRFPCGSAGKESTCNVGDLGSIPGLGRSPGKGKGYPLQYLGLENFMDCIVCGITKSQTWLSDFHFTSLHTKKKWNRKTLCGTKSSIRKTFWVKGDERQWWTGRK